MRSTVLRDERAGPAEAGKNPKADELALAERSEPEPSKEPRSGGGAANVGPESDRLRDVCGAARDVEVLAKPRRRQFTAAYKLEILQKAERCRDAKSIGSLLRSEGLYSSHLGKWR